MRRGLWSRPSFFFIFGVVIVFSFLFFFSLGCVSEVSVPLPPAPKSAQTAIAVVQESDETWTIVPIDVRRPFSGVPLAPKPDRQVYILYYRCSLPQLGRPFDSENTPRTFDLSFADEGLPDTDLVYAGTTSIDGILHWQSLRGWSDLPDAVREGTPRWVTAVTNFEQVESRVGFAAELPETDAEGAVFARLLVSRPHGEHGPGTDLLLASVLSEESSLRLEFESPEPNAVESGQYFEAGRWTKDVFWTVGAQGLATFDLSRRRHQPVVTMIPERSSHLDAWLVARVDESGSPRLASLRTDGKLRVWGPDTSTTAPIAEDNLGVGVGMAFTPSAGLIVATQTSLSAFSDLGEKASGVECPRAGATFTGLENLASLDLGVRVVDNRGQISKVDVVDGKWTCIEEERLDLYECMEKGVERACSAVMASIRGGLLHGFGNKLWWRNLKTGLDSAVPLPALKPDQRILKMQVQAENLFITLFNKNRGGKLDSQELLALLTCGLPPENVIPRIGGSGRDL